MKFLLFSMLFVVLCSSFVLGVDDEYKPYLHQPVVPEHPELKLYGEYATNLYAGGATYSFGLDVPVGVNGLTPSVVLSYNSQSMNTRPGVLGAGWSLNKDLLYRDVNGTIGDTSDDRYFLSLQGSLYELVYTEGEYRSKVNYFFRIQNYSNHWVVTLQDGTQYRFGYSDSSRVITSWYLDYVVDTLGNEIFYSYEKNPHSEDSNALYLSEISYNSDERRSIHFIYENNVRSDRRLVYSQGELLEESRRLSSIEVSVDDMLVRRYDLSYVDLSVSMSSLSSITELGSDNSSDLYTLNFSYYVATPGYNLTSKWYLPEYFSNVDHEDYGTRLVDFNNDGLVDMIRHQGGTQSKVYLNDGKNFTLNATTFTSATAIVDNNRVDRGVRFVDINLDGFVDVVRGQDTYDRKIYLNTKTNWVLDGNYTFPINFVTSSGADKGVRLADVNADGYIDVLRGDGPTKQVYLSDGSGWNLSSWVLPESFISSGVDTGTRLVDVNGDGYVDILRGKSGVKKAYLGNGTGWILNGNYTPPTDDFVTGPGKDRGVRFFDVNGDGLVDIVEDFFNGTSSKGVWLNTGRGWSNDSSWQSPVAFSSGGYSIGRRLADVNGDGYSDVLVGRVGTDKEVYVKNNTYPYLLSAVRTAYDGTSSIVYAPSTQFNNSLNGTSTLGFNMWVVSNVTLDTGLVNGSVNYSYSGGRYDYVEREFRGFSNVTEFNLIGFMHHYFYQDEQRKGIEYMTEVFDDSGLLSRSLSEYSSLPDGDTYNVSIVYTAQFLYDGNSEPVVSNTSYLYNRFGNYEFVTDHGDVSVFGDERYYNYTYALNTDDWIVDKVARKKTLDYKRDVVSDEKFYYDDRGLGSVENGLLTKQVQWNNYGNDTSMTYEYDSYGNVVEQINSHGDIHRFVYDSSHVYLSSEVNNVGHISFYEYNMSNGNLLSEEMNGIVTSYVYDVFGRLVKEIRPYDSFSSPTMTYDYDLDGVFPEVVRTSQKTTANNSLDVSYFYDGFGNLVQLKTRGEQGDIVKNIFYDAEGRVVGEQLPFYATYSADFTPLNTSAASNTSYFYDGAGRITLVVNGDGSTKNVSFDRYNITDYDENGNKHVYELDSYGRIIFVYEFNVNDVGIAEMYVTSYSYDDNDNLVLIVDDEGNEFSFLYDSLSRKVLMRDPDLGTWSYVYDELGNLVSQTDNRNETIVLTYDALNRISSKLSSDVNISFSYDEQFYGTLSNISFLNHSIGYVYDDRYRVIREEQRVDDLLFGVDFLYDSADRLLSERGPVSLDYYYNRQGLVYKIPGYLIDAEYESFGGLSNKTYSNGLVTTYSYYGDNNRLQSIVVPTVQNVSYGYDAVGNILSISDSINDRNHVMTYDSLHRLRTATIGSDTYRYSFNSIGNLMKMVHNDSVKHYVYGDSVAHAPDYIVEGVAGVDVYNPTELATGSKNRTFEAWLINDGSISSFANLSVSFDDSHSFSNESILVNDSVWVFVEHNYSRGGDYEITFSSEEDSQVLSTKFGARAQSLDVLYSLTNNSIFEFVVYNDVVETIENVSWNCSDGIQSLLVTDLSGYQSLYDYIARTYPRPGEYTFSCTVNSLDGSDSKSITFQVEGVSIEDYDVLVEDISHRVTSFVLDNDLIPMNVSLFINNETEQNISFGSDENVFAFVEHNYSSDGYKEVQVIVNNSDYETSHEDTFVLQGVSVSAYDRVSTNGTNSLFMFETRNNWYNGTVVTNFTEVGLSLNSSLDTNESVLIFVEKSYSEGEVNPELVSYVDVYQERVTDVFSVRPLAITSFLTLSEGSNAVSEVVVNNLLNESQSFDLSLDTEDQLFSDSLSINTSTLFMFIETNHSGFGVLETNATINNTVYADSAVGVIVK